MVVVEEKGTANKLKIRKAIGLLQIYPLVEGVFAVIAYLFDSYGIDIMYYLNPVCGFSFFMSLLMFVVACCLCLSMWNKIMNLAFTIITLIDFLDIVFCFNLNFINLQMVINGILIVGIIVSFITFLYDKWKYKI